MKTAILGLAASLFAALLTIPASALPRASGFNAPGLVQQVDRRCYWKHGHRHCRDHGPSIVIDLGGGKHHGGHHNDHRGDNHHGDKDHHDNGKGDHHGDKH
jgi:hypothetical protein